MKFEEVRGDLIKLAKKGMFDVIAHGVNCYCRQKSGIAKVMVKAFSTDKFIKESMISTGDINKLGTIDFMLKIFDEEGNTLPKPIFVVNCYTQFKIKQFSEVVYDYSTKERPLDYEALALCMRKMNNKFAGRHIGLPKIGCGKAEGNWIVVKEIIRDELCDCDVTIVEY